MPAMTSPKLPEPTQLSTLTATTWVSGATDAMPRPLLVILLETKVPWKKKSRKVVSSTGPQGEEPGVSTLVLSAVSTLPARSMWVGSTPVSSTATLPAGEPNCPWAQAPGALICSMFHWQPKKKAAAGFGGAPELALDPVAVPPIALGAGVHCTAGSAVTAWMPELAPRLAAKLGSCEVASAIPKSPCTRVRVPPAAVTIDARSGGTAPAVSIT